MISSNNYYHDHITSNQPDGLCKVDLTKVLGCTHYIRFTKSLDELLLKFDLFDKLMTGSYDINFDGKSGEHYIDLMNAEKTTDAG